MKKLLAILLVAMLAAPIFAGTDILNFMWFSNMMGTSFSDQYNASDKEPNPDAQNFNNKGWFHYINFFMCGMWGTIYDGGSNFSIGMDWFNGLQLRKDGWTSAGFTTIEDSRFKMLFNITQFYTLGLGAEMIAKFNGGTSFDWNWQADQFYFENTIKIPNIMNININFMDRLAWDGWEEETDMDLFFTLGLSGSYPFGFSWSLGEDVILTLNLENYKDTAIDASGNGPGSNNNGFADQGPYLLANRQEHDAWQHTPLLRTKLNISQEVLHFAGVKDVTLTLSLGHVFKVHVPFADALDNALGQDIMPNTVINTETKVGLNIGLYGISIGLAFLLATQDSVNATQGFDNDTAEDPLTTDDDIYVGDRPNGRGQIGLQLALGYSRGFFSFNVTYTGQAQIRDYDYYRDNFVTAIASGPSETYKINGGDLWDVYYGWYRWANQIDIVVSFSW